MIAGTRHLRGATIRRATLTADAIMGVGLTMLLAAMFAAVVHQYGRATRLDDARTELRRAAENELLRLRAEGVESRSEAAPEPETAESEEGILVETTTTDGAAEWSGMTRVCVRASRMVEGGRIQIELIAMLPAAEERP